MILNLRNNRILIPTILVLLASGFYLLAKSPLGVGTTQKVTPIGPPKITWSIPRVSEVIFPGASKTMTVNFQSSGDLSNVVVWITPSLDGIVSTAPKTFLSITANRSYEIAITLLAPQSNQKRDFGGTIHLRNGSGPPRTYAEPLTVILRTDFFLYDDKSLGFGFMYPPDWQIRVLPATANEEPTVSLVSALGSRVTVLPRGGLSYGIDPESIVKFSSLNAQNRRIIRANYHDPGGVLVLVRAVFDPPISISPIFRVDFRPMANDVSGEAVFEQILRTLQVR